jgi:hypothetical protein
MVVEIIEMRMSVRMLDGAGCKLIVRYNGHFPLEGAFQDEQTHPIRRTTQNRDTAS